MKKKENIFIETWKGTIELLVKTYKLAGLTDEKEKIKELAREQYNRLYETRPVKALKLEEQNMTETQREYLKYLTKVCETGEL